jgi:hypothetical protein
VMGHAARGLGDTVSVLGHVAEEITAETGKVRIHAHIYICILTIIINCIKNYLMMWIVFTCVGV